MQVESDKVARIIWIGMGATVVVFGAVETVGLYRSNDGAFSLLSLVFVGIGVASAVYGGRRSWIRVDQQTVTYAPTVGKTRTAKRSAVASIVCVPGSRTGPRYQFRDQNGSMVLEIGMGFNESGLERVANYLGVLYNSCR